MLNQKDIQVVYVTKNGKVSHNDDKCPALAKAWTSPISALRPQKVLMYDNVDVPPACKLCDPGVKITTLVKIDRRKGYAEWIKKAKEMGMDYKCAVQQWRLYWQGERGLPLHDGTVFLLDKYGY
jgi:hypothetical protein